MEHRSPSMISIIKRSRVRDIHLGQILPRPGLFCTDGWFGDRGALQLCAAGSFQGICSFLTWLRCVQSSHEEKNWLRVREFKWHGGKVKL